MADFRNPRNNGQSLPPSFGGSISGLITRGASSIVEEEVSAPSRRGSSNKKIQQEIYPQKFLVGQKQV
jgi:hypothetical protein